MHSRITINHKQMNGEPCIRSLRIPVSTVVTMVAQGISIKDIISFYPDLEEEDIKAALEFAAESVREHQLPLVDQG